MLEGAHTDARDKFYAALQEVPTSAGNPYLIRILTRSSELIKWTDIEPREAYKIAYREAYNKWVKDTYKTEASNEQAPK